MQYEIKRFDLASVFKISFLVYLVIGLLLGLFYSMIIGTLFHTLAPLMEDQGLSGISKIAGGGLFILAIVMAVGMAVVWSILTVIAAALYNLLAGSLGGLKVELADVKPLYPTAPSATNLPPAPPA